LARFTVFRFILIQNKTLPAAPSWLFPPVSSFNAHADSADALVELRDVRFGYGERVVLDGITLSVPRGKVTALMGGSGCGKTTVLRLIGGQQRAQAGQVLFDGQDVGQLRDAALYAARRRMGMLFQFGALFTDLSVYGNVAFPLREHTALPERLIRDIVLMKLGAVGLRGARDLMPAEVSGGMARRVALARAIALDPDLVMYDEPFAGLDPISLATAARLIRRLNDALHLTSMLVSHDVDETFRIADQVILLADGKIAAQGTPTQVRASRDPLVRQFIGLDADGPVRFEYPGPTVEQDFGVTSPSNPSMSAQPEEATA
jgi:phospholipid/cholesterol/gamma-HCH transport system ATP-binding protein